VHPTEEILLGVASGESDLPRRILVEGHLEGCASCRATMAELTLPGGALLRGLDGQEPPSALWQGLLGRIARLPQPAPAPAPDWPSPPVPPVPIPPAMKTRSGTSG